MEIELTIPSFLLLDSDSRREHRNMALSRRESRIHSLASATPKKSYMMLVRTMLPLSFMRIRTTTGKSIWSFSPF